MSIFVYLIELLLYSLDCVRLYFYIIHLIVLIL